MSNVRLSVMVDLNIRALAKQKAALRRETMPAFISAIVTDALAPYPTIPSTKPKLKGGKK